MKKPGKQVKHRSRKASNDAGEALIVGLLTFPVWFILYRYGPLNEWINSLETTGIYAVFGTIMLTYAGIYIVIKLIGTLLTKTKT